MGIDSVTDKAKETPDYYGQLERENGHPIKSVEGRFVNLVWMCEDCGMKSTHLEDFQDESCLN
jgi:hypothetical protein